MQVNCCLVTLYWCFSWAAKLTLSCYVSFVQAWISPDCWWLQDGQWNSAAWPLLQPVYMYFHHFVTDAVYLTGTQGHLIKFQCHGHSVYKALTRDYIPLVIYFISTYVCHYEKFVGWWDMKSVLSLVFFMRQSDVDVSN